MRSISVSLFSRVDNLTNFQCLVIEFVWPRFTVKKLNFYCFFKKSHLVIFQTISKYLCFHKSNIICSNCHSIKWSGPKVLWVIPIAGYRWLFWSLSRCIQKIRNCSLWLACLKLIGTRKFGTSWQWQYGNRNWKRKQETVNGNANINWKR